MNSQRLGLLLLFFASISSSWARNIDPVSVAEQEYKELEERLEEKLEEEYPDRSKRTIGNVARFATCVFTFLFNPNCFQNLQRSRSRGRSSVSQRQQEYYNQWLVYQQQLLQWMRNNGSEGNYSTPFPIFPPPPTTEAPPEDDRPTNPIAAFINWKLNLIPNTLRFLFPNTFGRRQGAQPIQQRARTAQNFPTQHAYTG